MTPEAGAEGRLAGRVALVTGAARGQGRSHAVRLADEGADVIGIDVCRDMAGIDYPMATPDDLADTARMVEATGRRVVTDIVDVRDIEALRCAVDAAAGQLGRLDVVVANASVCAVRCWDEVDAELWETIIGINLTGAWNTCVVALPHLLRGGRGSIILVSSAAGLKGQPFFAPYSATKHGLVGIMRSLANELEDAASGSTPSIPPVSTHPCWTGWAAWPNALRPIPRWARSSATPCPSACSTRRT